MVAPTSPPGPPQRESTWTNRWSEPPVALTRQRRFPRRIILGAVIIAAVFAGGIGAGWLLKPTQPAPAPHLPATAAASPAGAPTWTPQQAKDRACWAFVTVGTQWANAYHAWARAIQRPGWEWTDPEVVAAANAFRPIQAETVTQLEVLVPSNTPIEVATAIHDYTSAILQYAASFSGIPGPDMTTEQQAINSAGAAADRACGLPPA